MKLAILILLLVFCFVVDGHRFKSRRRNKGSASRRVSVSFPKQFPFMEDLKVPPTEKLLTLDEFRSQINGVWWTAVYLIGTDDLSPGLAFFLEDVSQEKLEWNLQDDGRVKQMCNSMSDVWIYSKPKGPRIGEQCVQDGDNDLMAVSDEFAIFRRTRDGITREDRYVSSNTANYLIQFICEDVSTIQNGKCTGGSLVEIYARNDPPDVIEYDKIAFDYAKGFCLNIGDRRSILLYKGRRCEDDALFPPEFEFNENIKIPQAMTKQEFNKYVSGKAWEALIIIISEKISSNLQPFVFDVVHEQLRWVAQPSGVIFREFVYRPKLGVPCINVGNDSDFRWASDELAIMQRTRGSITRRDYFVGGKGYLIKFLCNDISDIEGAEGESQTCGEKSAVVEVYTDMQIPDRIPWHLVVADLEKIMLNTNDRRARWLYVDDRTDYPEDPYVHMYPNMRE